MPAFSRFPFLAGGFFALTAVILGAFGAHALQDLLAERETTYAWETAVQYQMWHALALILVALLPTENRLSLAMAGCFTLGVVLFSGSLYWLATGGPGWIGPVTPLGGLSLIVGWVLFLARGFKPADRS